MKELPILFKPDMVDAIIEDRKTQTRRIVKPQPEWHNYDKLRSAGWHWEGSKRCLIAWPQIYTFAEELKKYCPYKPGDIFYVRETCWIWGKWIKNGLTKTGKQAWTFKTSKIKQVSYKSWGDISRTESGFHKRPSIFMPKWAARLWLKVKSIRVERVQDISEADAKAEGIDARPQRAIPWFIDLWDRINASRGYSFKSNPWVWVVEFEKIEK